MKKLLVPVSLALLLIIAMAGTVLAAPKANGPQLPLKGTLESQETYVVNPPIMSVTASGSGNATQLGRYSINYQFQVNLETVAGVGCAQFIAANGDRLIQVSAPGHSRKRYEDFRNMRTFPSIYLTSDNPGTTRCKFPQPGTSRTVCRSLRLTRSRRQSPM